MKAEELRIGNFTEQGEILSIIKDGGNYLVYTPKPKDKSISPQVRQDIVCHFVQSLIPISLTEEWLIKFGFDKRILNKTEQTTVYNYYIKSPEGQSGEWGLTINIDFEKPLARISNTWLTRKIDYVHQLQNLYFAITGIELKLNEHEN